MNEEIFQRHLSEENYHSIANGSTEARNELQSALRVVGLVVLVLVERRHNVRLNFRAMRRARSNFMAKGVDALLEHSFFVFFLVFLK